VKHDEDYLEPGLHEKVAFPDWIERDDGADGAMEAGEPMAKILLWKQDLGWLW
jgi:hypothetical protein